MVSGIHKGDIGTRFLLTIKDYTTNSTVDISNASSRQILLKKPDDTVSTLAASILGDGSSQSGVMYYDVVDGDLDAAGMYKLQGKVVLASGTFSTDIYSFQVNCNLG